MQKNHLKRKLNLYLEGKASKQTAEKIEEWLSDGSERPPSLPEQLLQEEERRILADIREQTQYPLFYPSKEDKDLKQVVLIGIVVGCLFLVALLLMRH
jgi:hypothetical protein